MVFINASFKIHFLKTSHGIPVSLLHACMRAHTQKRGVCLFWDDTYCMQLQLSNALSEKTKTKSLFFLLQAYCLIQGLLWALQVRKLLLKLLFFFPSSADVCSICSFTPKTPPLDALCTWCLKGHSNGLTPK